VKAPRVTTARAGLSHWNIRRNTKMERSTNGQVLECESDSARPNTGIRNVQRRAFHFDFDDSLANVPTREARRLIARLARMGWIGGCADK
jgi:hypothetical protein